MPSYSARQGGSSFNQPLSFDTFSVTNMRYIFSVRSGVPITIKSPCARCAYLCTLLTPPLYPTPFPPSSPHLAAPRVSLSARQYASAFNQPLDFDTSNVNDMSGMFGGATAFNQPLSFDTSNVTDMHDMFAVRSQRVPCPHQPVGPRTVPVNVCTLIHPRGRLSPPVVPSACPLRICPPIRLVRVGHRSTSR